MRKPTLNIALLRRIFVAANIRRWNDQATPVEFYELDKQAHKIVIAYLLAHFEEIENGRKVDWERLILQFCYEFFERIILTDIKPPVFHKLANKHNKELVDFVCKESYDLRDFIALIDYLRSPKGCPWDREQTHESIRRNVLEEAYEVCEAIDEGSPEHLCEELGDLLMQVILHASMAKDEGAFDMDAIADMACKKLVHRHPHVFGAVAADTPEKVLENWDAIKRADRAQQTAASAMDGVSHGLPGLMRSEKIQNKAAKLGFDWPAVGGAMDKLREEVGELQEGIDAGDVENIKEELGDVLFSAVNVARFYKLDSEELMHAACGKFIRRFRYVEEGAAKLGRRLEDMSLEEMEEIYQQGRHDLEGKEPVPVSHRE